MLYKLTSDEIIFCESKWFLNGSKIIYIRIHWNKVISRTIDIISKSNIQKCRSQI